MLCSRRSEEFPRFVQRDCARKQFLFQAGTEHLINPADARPIPAQALECEQEPQALNSLAECPRRMLGHVPRILDHPLVVCLLRSVGFGNALFEGFQIAPVPNPRRIQTGQHRGQ